MLDDASAQPCSPKRHRKLSSHWVKVFTLSRKADPWSEMSKGMNRIGALDPRFPVARNQCACGPGGDRKTAKRLPPGVPFLRLLKGSCQLHCEHAESVE